MACGNWRFSINRTSGPAALSLCVWHFNGAFSLWFKEQMKWRHLHIQTAAWKYHRVEIFLYISEMHRKRENEDALEEQGRTGHYLALVKWPRWSDAWCSNHVLLRFTNLELRCVHNLCLRRKIEGMPSKLQSSDAGNGAICAGRSRLASEV